MDTISKATLTHDFLEVSESFARLHPVALKDSNGVLRLLQRVRQESVELRRGMNRRILPETAEIIELDADSLVLRTRNFESDAKHRVFLNFSVDGVPYFFSSLLIERQDPSHVRVELPSVIYQSERRDRYRSKPGKGDAKRIELFSDGQSSMQVEIVDRSPQGLGIAIKESSARSLSSHCRVRFLDGHEQGKERFAEVRQSSRLKDRTGWIHLGLEISDTMRDRGLRVESLDTHVIGGSLSRLSHRWKIASAAVKFASQNVLEKFAWRESEKPDLRVIDYENSDCERIRAIVDSTGETRGALAIVIPPAWGKTKESLMPLAVSIRSAFAAAGVPVAIIRFDGIRKKGESHNEVRGSGVSEHQRFTFSQGVRDIRATIDFLERSPEFGPSKTIVISFSASSIETRRAVAEDSRIDGWISVVGAPDLQSMMRVISGGIDYAAGLEKGISFGLQQILGIEVDMDFTGLDAFRHDMVYIEDARRDMERISVPVTWIHGKFDAWMSSERSQDVLSRGDAGARRFIEVQTGHMLRTSAEALSTFQLVTREASRIALGYELTPVVPNLRELQLRSEAERSRTKTDGVHLQQFWKDYLVGKDGDIGIELMTSIAPFQALMKAQVDQLRLSDGDLVIDLGSGTGSFPRFITANDCGPSGLRIVEVDFVTDGFARTIQKLADDPGSPALSMEFVESNLDLCPESPGVPISGCTANAVIASLMLSYVKHPELLLLEIHRILKQGGRIVVSSLRRDADMSKLYMDGIEELRSGLARQQFGVSGEREIEKAARQYLNQASRLLELEEVGEFRFWDSEELEDLVRSVGFAEIESRCSLGTPPQAVVVSGTRP